MITDVVTSIGFINTEEYAVNIIESNAKIKPVIFVLDDELSELIGKIRKASPTKIVNIPTHESIGGISSRNIKPNIPANKSGKTNKINDKVNGDNLFKDAKNKLSPTAIPKIPLKAILIIVSVSIFNEVCDSIAIINNNIELKIVFSIVIPTGSSLSPRCLKIIEQIAQVAVEIKAITIPKIELVIFIKHIF